MKGVSFLHQELVTVISRMVGKSHTALQTFGSVVGMPTMHLSTFQDHDKKVTDMCFSLYFSCMCVCVSMCVCVCVCVCVCLTLCVSVSPVNFHFFTDTII